MPRAAARFLVALGVLALLGGAAVWGVTSFLRSLDSEPLAKEQCTAVNDEIRFALSHEQADNAALLAASSLRRGLPARAATIAIATAMQESSLRNIDHGDRDSLGLFQQRPSQGWGSEEEIMDPVYSTDTFYDALVEVDGFEDMEITVAAQTVQRSAFPDAYAQHEAMARAWASALTGHSPAAVTCIVHEPVRGDAEAFVERVGRDLGDVGAQVVSGDDDDEPAVIELEAAALGRTDAEPRLAWALAQWAVAAGARTGVTEVAVGERRWTAAAAAWVGVEDTAALPTGLVRVTLLS